MWPPSTLRFIFPDVSVQAPGRRSPCVRTMCVRNSWGDLDVSLSVPSSSTEEDLLLLFRALLAPLKRSFHAGRPPHLLSTPSPEGPKKHSDIHAEFTSHLHSSHLCCVIGTDALMVAPLLRSLLPCCFSRTEFLEPVEVTSLVQILGLVSSPSFPEDSIEQRSARLPLVFLRFHPMCNMG